MKTASNRTIISLCTMLFLQYMLVAVWWIPYAAYLTRHEIPDATKAIALSAMAVGFMTSSIVGAIADRYLPAQKVLAATNLAVSLLLLAAGLSSSPTLTIILIYIIMLLYMPTWALTGSITLKHVSQQQFPRIRLFGTLGWVSSGLFSIIALNIFQNTTFDSSSLTYLCGSAVALLAALHALTIPHTPPTATKQKLTLARILGFEALTLFRDRNCLAWFLLTFAAVLGYAMYYTYIGWFFNDRGFHLITATVSLGQLGEILFLYITTRVLRKAGIKRTMLLGLAALTLRYALFLLGVATGSEPLYIAAVLLHGAIFSFFFVSGQIYTDRKTPSHLRAQSQGLMAFLLWGVALLTGNWLCHHLIAVHTTLTASGAPVYDWQSIFTALTLWSLLILILFAIHFKDPDRH